MHYLVRGSGIVVDVCYNKYLFYVIYYLSKDIYRSAIIANCQKTYYEEDNLSV